MVKADLTQVTDVASLLNGLSSSEIISLLNRMHDELLRTKSDCSLTMGLVGQMHRNMSNKVTSYSISLRESLSMF